MDEVALRNTFAEAQQLLRGIPPTDAFPAHHKIGCGVVLCACFNYKDTDGQPVAENFKDLPSSHYVTYHALAINPQSLNTVKSRLLGNSYKSAKEFYIDIKSIFCNYAFVATEHPTLWKTAQELDSHIDVLWTTVVGLQRDRVEKGTLSNPIPHLDDMFNFDSSSQKPPSLLDDQLSEILKWCRRSKTFNNAQYNLNVTNSDTERHPVHLSQVMSVDKIDPANIIEKVPSEPVDGPPSFEMDSDVEIINATKSLGSSLGKRSLDEAFDSSRDSVPTVADNVIASVRPSREPSVVVPDESKSQNASKALAELTGSSKKIKYLNNPDSRHGWLQDVSTLDVAQYASWVIGLVQECATRADTDLKLNSCPRRPFRSFQDKVAQKPCPYESIREFDADMYQLFGRARQAHVKTGKTAINLLQRLYSEFHCFNPTQSACRKQLDTLRDNIMHCVPVDFRADEISPGDKRSKTILEAIHFKTVTLRVGDWVRLLNRANLQKPIIGQIFECWMDINQAQSYVTIRRYFRPEDTIHDLDRRFIKKELFRSSLIICFPIEEFLGRCWVMSIRDFLTGRPPAKDDCPVYVCRAGYDKTLDKFSDDPDDFAHYMPPGYTFPTLDLFEKPMLETELEHKESPVWGTISKLGSLSPPKDPNTVVQVLQSASSLVGPNYLGVGAAESLAVASGIPNAIPLRHPSVTSPKELSQVNAGIPVSVAITQSNSSSPQLKGSIPQHFSELPQSHLVASKTSVPSSSPAHAYNSFIDPSQLKQLQQSYASHAQSQQPPSLHQLQQHQVFQVTQQQYLQRMQQQQIRTQDRFLQPEPHLQMSQSVSNQQQTQHPTPSPQMRALSHAPRIQNSSQPSHASAQGYHVQRNSPHISPMPTPVYPLSAPGTQFHQTVTSPVYHRHSLPLSSHVSHQSPKNDRRVLSAHSAIASSPLTNFSATGALSNTLGEEVQRPRSQATGIALTHESANTSNNPLNSPSATVGLPPLSASEVACLSSLTEPQRAIRWLKLMLEPHDSAANATSIVLHPAPLHEQYLRHVSNANTPLPPLQTFTNIITTIFQSNIEIRQVDVTGRIVIEGLRPRQRPPRSASHTPLLGQSIPSLVTEGSASTIGPALSSLSQTTMSFQQQLDNILQSLAILRKEHSDYQENQQRHYAIQQQHQANQQRRIEKLEADLRQSRHEQEQFKREANNWLQMMTNSQYVSSPSAPTLGFVNPNSLPQVRPLPDPRDFVFTQVPQQQQPNGSPSYGS